MDNKLYWEQFYKEHHIKEPSGFAKALGFKHRSILDMGCGNGRDTSFFDATDNLAVGVDEFAPEGDDFRRMRIEEFIKGRHRYDVLYMRFLLHAIDEKLESEIIEWASCNVNEVYIECRSDKGVVPDATHPRRLISGEKLKLKLVSSGFDIKYFAEQTGFALYGDEDPVIIRLVAKR